MGKKATYFSIAIFVILLTALVFGQEQNPDRYTSITLGAGFTASEQTFLNSNYPGVEWKRFVDIPQVYIQYLVPISDKVSLISYFNYNFKVNSEFDNDTNVKGDIYMPRNTVLQTYHGMLAVKFYFK